MSGFKDDDYKNNYRDIDFETVEIDPEVEEKIEEIQLREQRRRHYGNPSGPGPGKSLFASLWSIAKIALFFFVALPILFYLFIGTLGFFVLAIPVFIGILFILNLFR